MPAANPNSKHSSAWKEMTDHESLWGKIMSFLNKIYSWLTGSKSYSTTEQRDTLFSNVQEFSELDQFFSEENAR